MQPALPSPRLTFGQLLARLLFALLMLAAAGIVAWAIIHTIRTDSKVARAAHQSIPVETVRARVKTMNEVIGAAGLLRSNELVGLTARIAQRVDRTPGDIGKIMRQGEVLMEFDQRTLKATLTNAEHLLALARVNETNGIADLGRIETLYNQKLAAAQDLEAAQAALAKARADVAAGELAVAQANLDLENAVVHAPVNCIVLNRQVNPGESTLVGQPTFNLGTLDYVLLIAQVAEERVSSVGLGLPAEIGFDAYPGEIFKGEVTKIDPTTTPTNHAFPCYLKIANADLRLKPGLTGFARIYHQKMTLAVPSVAIMNPVGDHATVFVITNDWIAHLRNIRTGIVADGFTEVLFGLDENERVVTVGQLGLNDNDKVPPQKN